MGIAASGAGSTHRYKYRLAFVVTGECVLRYDNEVGKGDHVHSGGKERAYVFVDPDRLVADFIADVRGWLMRTVTLDVRSLSDSLADFARTWKSGKGEGSARISFDTPELL